MHALAPSFIQERRKGREMITKQKATTQRIFKKASRLHLEVFISSPDTFQATSTLIYGDKDLILIDAQFTNSEARRLAARIKATGRKLATVYITHGHPDHYWGLNVIRDAFPNAKFVSVPEVIEVINRLQPAELSRWKPVLGDDIPGLPIIPEPLRENMLELEGNTIAIIKQVQGDVDGSSFVWIPTMKAIVCGDIVYDNVNVWVLESDKAARERWARTLDQIASLKPEIVVAGHAEFNSQNGPGAISFTKRYLAAYDRAVETSKSADEVVVKIKAEFPQLNGLDGVLQMAANAAFIKK